MESEHKSFRDVTYADLILNVKKGIEDAEIAFEYDCQYDESSACQRLIGALWMAASLVSWRDDDYMEEIANRSSEIQHRLDQNRASVELLVVRGEVS